MSAISIYQRRGNAVNGAAIARARVCNAVGVKNLDLEPILQIDAAVSPLLAMLVRHQRYLELNVVPAIFKLLLAGVVATVFGTSL